MFLDSLLALPIWLILVCLGAAFILYSLHNKHGHALSKIPGPFLAAYSDYWRFFLVWGRRPELTHVRLHEKYGDLVRIGPKTVLVSDWDAVKKIYGLNAGYVKVSFALIRISSSEVSWLTLQHQSLDFIQFSRTLRGESPSSASSIPPMRNSTANSGVLLQTHIR